MKTIIDLTMPVEAHFRWPVERKLVGSFEREDDFQITWIGMGVHGFTHVDAPRHMVPSGGTTSDIGLDRIVGEAVVIDLTGIRANTAITAEHLAAKAPSTLAGDIVLLRTAWDMVESYKTPEFWNSVPVYDKRCL